MRTRKKDIRPSLSTPLVGYGIMLLSLGCFLILLWVLTIVVRVVLG
ncbi:MULTISPECIES: hypothetical protein [Gordonibacter]|uniref:Uncharacterized protein n=1 Tax=Gordonibacter faecis TaxID=3047475 RepID=A0ABT7DPK3_9ACTN|nr:MULTISPECIES: hypothetical protein [unclassified Gordonibacter]MDJ1651479.1 hypothetical protein [Gordonibacter sp. KGMB12511]